MKRLRLILILLFVCALPLSAAAQETDDSLPISFTRDFGYAAGGKIQGTFSLKVRESDELDLVAVEFLVDGSIVFTDTESPFRYQFNTANYAEGAHTLSAVGYKSDGTSLQSSEFSREFISSERAWSEAGNIVVPLLVGVVVLTLIGTLGPVLLGRKKEHRPGVYGAAGGAICPRCSFPFSRGFLSPNLLVGKLERCPHCGKWSIVPRATPFELEAAEARLAQESQGTLTTPSEEEKMRQLIDESRFED
jgi:hypothetical protein